MQKYLYNSDYYGILGVAADAEAGSSLGDAAKVSSKIYPVAIFPSLQSCSAPVGG